MSVSNPTGLTGIIDENYPEAETVVYSLPPSGKIQLKNVYLDAEEKEIVFGGQEPVE